MPRKVSDYSRSTIYKICCNDPAVTDVYVGSTTSFSKRKYSHKYSCNTTSSKKHNFYVYQFIRANGGWDAWDMVQIEAYNATTKRELEARERHWLETLGATLNKCIPTRTQQEYRENNREKEKEYQKKYLEENKDYHKKYRENNKDKIKETSKKYREENQDKITEGMKKYYENNKEKRNQYQRNYIAKQFAMKLHEFIHS